MIKKDLEKKLLKAYDNVYEIEHGFVVTYEDKEGIVDFEGDLIVPFKFDCVFDYLPNQNIIIIGRKTKDDKILSGLIDLNFKQITTTKYDEIYPFIESFATVAIDNKYGLIDTLGNEVIPLEFDSVESFDKGFFIVSKDNKKGCFNFLGKQIVDTIYDDLTVLDCATLKALKDNKYGCLDETGAEFIPFEYDSISEFNKNGYCYISKEGKFRFVNRKNENMSEYVYDSIILEENGIYKIEIDNKFGFLDAKLNEIMPPKLESAGKFFKGISKIKSNEKAVYINQYGEQVKGCLTRKSIYEYNLMKKLLSEKVVIPAKSKCVNYIKSKDISQIIEKIKEHDLSKQK